MAENYDRKVYEVSKGDELLLKSKVLDAHDVGNIVITVGDKTALASVADLEGAAQSGGRHRYYKMGPGGVEVEVDKFGDAVPTQAP